MVNISSVTNRNECSLIKWDPYSAKFMFTHNFLTKTKGQEGPLRSYCVLSGNALPLSSVYSSPSALNNNEEFQVSNSWAY